MKYGLSKATLDKIIGVLSSFSTIEEAILYGSRAMETYRNGSDIDICLKGNLTFTDLLRTERKLDDELLPYKIDLSIFQNIENEDLKQHINRIGKSLYIKKELQNKDIR